MPRGKRSPQSKADSQARVSALRHTVETLAEAVLSSPDDETFVGYLQWLSRFPRFSAHNTLLVHSQRADVTAVAGYRQWENLGRHVKRGEHGLAIFVPMRARKTTETDAETGEDVEKPGNTYFGIGYVFDVTQTEGDPLPNFRSPLENAECLLRAGLAFAANEGLQVSFSDTGLANGWASGGAITLSKEREVGTIAQTIVHEIAHELMGHVGGDLPNATKEAEAEAVAYVVLCHLGYDTKAASASYIRHHGATHQTVMASLERIQSIARRVIDGLEAVMVPLAIEAEAS
jgi:hypothetical protein